MWRAISCTNGPNYLENKLEALQCHFTWNLDPGSHSLTFIQKIVEDFGTEEGNIWLGHIYNLQGFIQYKLGSSKEALKFFSRATETFKRLKNSDEGPWLIVNFGNLAWLHHLMGEDEKSQDYLSKGEAMMSKYPAPPEQDLHPEVCAEKAWTLMRFDEEEAAKLFQRAIEMQPNNIEWQSSWAILSADTFRKSRNRMSPDVLEKLRSATENDPENLYVAALYLEAQALQIQHEVRELAKKVLERSTSRYNGITPLLRLYREYISKDEAVELAEQALKRDPDSRVLKRCAAICYVKKIFPPDFKPNTPRRTISRAITLWEEMLELYGESKLQDQITLADLYAKVNPEKPDHIYRELLDRENLDSAEKQMLYHFYAKYLFFNKENSHRSIAYHMKAAMIPEVSSYRQTSINELEKTLERNKNPSKSSLLAKVCLVKANIHTNHGLNYYCKTNVI
uniref:Interferon-induced protein with tetratricopeptide repeats 15 n=1 Tax=Cyprinodon variegatus TaxID=28743 RepID=A0A3Q2CE69_CYPVA